MNLKPFFAAITVTLSACGTTVHPPTKLYEGSLPPGVAPALVKPAAFIVISSIDGKRVHFAATGNTSGNDHELQFAPGRHDLMVSYYDGNFRGAVAAFSIEVESGRKYVLRQAINAKYIAPTQWRPILIDATDRPNCWTISVGLMFGPSGCDD